MLLSFLKNERSCLILTLFSVDISALKAMWDGLSNSGKLYYGPDQRQKEPSWLKAETSTKTRASMMVCGCVSAFYKGHVNFCDGIINTEKYLRF